MNDNLLQVAGALRPHSEIADCYVGNVDGRRLVLHRTDDGSFAAFRDGPQPTLHYTLDFDGAA